MSNGTNNELPTPEDFAHIKNHDLVIEYTRFLHECSPIINKMNEHAIKKNFLYMSYFINQELDFNEFVEFSNKLDKGIAEIELITKMKFREEYEKWLKKKGFVNE